MTDIQNLYADANKPNWAGGIYSPEMLDDGRKYDLRILSKRSNSRDLEITLPSELAGESAPDRALPVLINGNTDPLAQVAAVFCDGSDKGTVRFSRSEKGQEWLKSFIAGQAQMTLAHSKHGRKKSPCAFAIRAVSDGNQRIKKMSEQIEIPKDIIRKEVDAYLKQQDPIATPYVSDYQEREFSITNLLNAEVHQDYTNAGYEREMCQEAKRNYVGSAKGVVIPAEALWKRTTMTTSGDIAGAIGTDLRQDMYIDALRPMSSVIAAGGRMMSLSGKTSLPKNNNDVSAAWTTEGGAITESDIDIDVITLSPNMLAGRSSYSRHVLATATPEIETLVRRNLQLQISNALDDAALDGSGSGGQPTGIANTTGIETFATAGSSTMTHAESLSIIAEVGENNISTTGGVWLVHPTNAATLGSTAKDSGSGLFVYENGQIAGRRVIETTHVASGTAYFGLFDNVYIGMFGGVDVVVDQFTNASTGVINVYAYQLADVAVAHAGAFNKVTLTA